MPDLFAEPRERLAEGAVLLRGFALEHEVALLADLAQIIQAAPFRHMITPGGHRMSVGMTNCGRAGWVTDRSGYRYDAIDPETGKPWPALPPSFLALARSAADEAGFPGFAPDACLVNRYEPGAKLSLHQDRNEHDFAAPIVSVSLGLPAIFLFAGATRTEPTLKVPLVHGDVVVWGASSRLAFHGVATLKDGLHPALGRMRVNLTFRTAL